MHKILLKVDGGFLLRAFFFNLRKPEFQDVRVREALNDAFDFNWINKNYYYGFYVRTESYFGPNNRAAASAGIPSGAELALLEPYRSQLPARVFTTNVAMPDTDGTQDGLRRNLGAAMKLLQSAGYVQKNGVLVQASSGKPFEFEILVAVPEFQLAAQNWINNLKLLGINVTMRTLDFSQYIGRVRAFDYDVVAGWIPQVGTPGEEQRGRWGSQAADAKGSLNWSGVKSSIVDALTEKVIAAQTETDYLAAIHALDRVLMWGFYTVPLFNGGNKIPIAYWDRFGFPEDQPQFDQGYITYWWLDPKKDAALNRIAQQ